MSVLWGALRVHSQQRARHIALADSQREVPYGELIDAVEERANQLREMPVTVLAIALDNCVDWVLWDLAALRSDVICVPVPSFFSVRQRQHVFKNAGVDAVVDPIGLRTLRSTPVEIPRGTAKVSTETSANGAEPSQTTDTTAETPAAGPPGEDSHQPSSSQPIRSVFLFTDGRPTVGLRDAPSILQVMGNMLSPTPADADAMLNGEYEMSFATGGATTPAAVPPHVVKVHTFGFGQDSDPALLGAIADAGSGSYYYISNPDDIPAAFADALGGLLSVAAQNVALRVSPANGARVTGVRSGFPTTRDGPDFLVRVPDVYAEEVKDLVVAVELPSMHGEDVAEDCEFTAATVSIEFIDTVRSRPAVVAGEVRVRRSAEAEAERAAAGNLRVRAQVTRLNAMDSMLQV